MDNKNIHGHYYKLIAIGYKNFGSAENKVTLEIPLKGKTP
jgi:hypothetical protein